MSAEMTAAETTTQVETAAAVATTAVAETTGSTSITSTTATASSNQTNVQVYAYTKQIVDQSENLGMTVTMVQ